MKNYLFKLFLFMWVRSYTYIFVFFTNLIGPKNIYMHLFSDVKLKIFNNYLPILYNKTISVHYELVLTRGYPLLASRANPSPTPNHVSVYVLVLLPTTRNGRCTLNILLKRYPLCSSSLLKLKIVTIGIELSWLSGCS